MLINPLYLLALLCFWPLTALKLVLLYLPSLFVPFLLRLGVIFVNV